MLKMKNKITEKDISTDLRTDSALLFRWKQKIDISQWKQI